MVPQPVLAVLLLYPITKESEEADKKGEPLLAATAAATISATAAAARQPVWWDPWHCVLHVTGRGCRQLHTSPVALVVC